MNIEFIDYNSNSPYFRVMFENDIAFYCRADSFNKITDASGLYTIMQKDAPIPTWLEQASFTIEPVQKLDYTEIAESIVNYFINYPIPENSSNIYEIKANRLPKIYDKLLNSFIVSKDLVLIEILKTLYPDDGFVTSLYNLFLLPQPPVSKYYVYKFYFDMFASTYEISSGVKLRDYILNNMSANDRLLYDNALAIISSSVYVQNVKTSLGMTDTQVNAIFDVATKFMFSNYDEY